MVHLRVVVFTMVVVCAALFVLSSNGSSTDVDGDTGRIPPSISKGGTTKDIERITTTTGMPLPKISHLYRRSPMHGGSSSSVPFTEDQMLAKIERHVDKNSESKNRYPKGSKGYLHYEAHESKWGYRGLGVMNRIPEIIAGQLQHYTDRVAVLRPGPDKDNAIWNRNFWQGLSDEVKAESSGHYTSQQGGHTGTKRIAPSTQGKHRVSKPRRG